VDARTMLRNTYEMDTDPENAFFGTVLLANLPQLVLSVIYSIFNRVITTFTLSKEVQEFSIRPKGLRVSSVPHGAQRSQYFLQLPYRFALPFMLFSGILHWLCSQSLFLISIIEVLLKGTTAAGIVATTNAHENLTWGYSPQAILILALLAMLMYALLIGFGVQLFTSKMPITGSCSAVISAMCHQPVDEDGDEAVLKPLMWGVSSEEVQAGVCVVENSFSSREVRQPTADDMVTMWIEASWERYGLGWVSSLPIALGHLK
jgi:hypothetical protein